MRLDEQLIDLDDGKPDQDSAWLVHSTPSIDLAVLPLGQKVKTQRSFFLPEAMLTDVKEIQLGDDVIFGSVPFSRPSPIVLRRGMVAYKEDFAFLVDGQVFPGSSGSPVFLYEKPLLFAGIVIGYLPYRDQAVSIQTGEVRATFVENSGIGSAYTTRPLLDILESKAFEDSKSHAP